jgi:hypothetical protein
MHEYQTPPSYNFHKLFLTEFNQLRRKPMKLQHSLIGTSGDKLSPFVQEYPHKVKHAHLQKTFMRNVQSHRSLSTSPGLLMHEIS